MYKVHVYQEPDICRRLWEKFWPQECFFDLWPVRDCFMKHYQRSPFFLTLEKDKTVQGLLALSWIDEEGYFGHFPGETYTGKTWLEQNKIPVSDKLFHKILMENVPGNIYLRYLDQEFIHTDTSQAELDEIGYLFFPYKYNYSFGKYLQTFSNKTWKKIEKEIQTLYSKKVHYRYNHKSDIDLMLDMNLSIFGEHSYFHDKRFLNSFIELTKWLYDSKLLRITSTIIGGQVAAIDLGAVWNNTYTVLAGGVYPGFPGIAKLINFHHIEWACRKRISIVDFLCGDFKWKERFHLTPRPLYKLQSLSFDNVIPLFQQERKQIFGQQRSCISSWHNS